MYFQLSKCTFSQQFQYRESMVFQAVGEFMWIYIQLCIWQTLLAFQVDGRSFEEMIVYVLASEMLSVFLRSNVAMELAEKVRTGAIAVDLIRPVNLKWYSFWEQFSVNLFSFLFVGCPNLFLVLILYPVIPMSVWNLFCFFLCAGFAVLLNFYFQYVVGLFSFWFKDGTYARMMIDGLMTIFSGRKIPLWFYPPFLYGICRFLPFRFMVYEPVAVLLGQYGMMESLGVLGVQVFWIGFFWIFERFVWYKVQRQIEVQGG